MRLINIQTKQPIVEFIGEKTLIHNKFLEDEMRIMGIPIPDGLRGPFEGKDYIYLGETKFQEAFREVYYVTYMDPRRFKWAD
jgi:hypothetical protein